MGSKTASVHSNHSASDEYREEHILVELIEEPSAVARYVVQARKSGERLLCARCEDDAAIITAILILPLAEAPLTWALCRDCQSEFPHKDTLFYRLLDD